MKNLFRPTSLKRMIFFLGVDLILSSATLYLAYLLRFNFHIPEEFLGSFWLTYAVLTGAKVAFLFFYKNYFIVWRFFSFYDAQNIVKAHIWAYLFFIMVYLLFNESFSPFPRSVIAIDFFLSLIFIGAIRTIKRLLRESRGQHSLKPTLIIGINSKTSTIIQSALKEEIDYYPVAISTTQENKTMTDAYINNVKVIDIQSLDTSVYKKKIIAAIITEKLLPNELKKLVTKLNEVGITEIKQVKLLGSDHEKLEDLSIEDLLARNPKDLDSDTIKDFIQNKSILITGAGGSIGSEIAKQCQAFGASSLTLLDNSEYNLYQIGEQLDNADLRLIDVTDQSLLLSLFEEVTPQIVIHAAAYKHVPICENNQEIVVFNNIVGTKNVIDISIKVTVEKVVVISTDKAVRPTNVMGATKRVTELYANNVDAENTEIVAVRFGNVLGSSGSVIPKFKQQTEEGGPVTVTHPDITRYFMLISEACQLVLQTAAIAKGGELFVLDMGEPIKIVDLAKQMIRLYGKEDEIDIVFIGLRPGEKLYEELLLDESEQETRYSSIFIAQPTPYDMTQLNRDIDNLIENDDKLVHLKKIVPEFNHMPNDG